MSGILGLFPNFKYEFSIGGLNFQMGESLVQRREAYTEDSGLPSDVATRIDLLERSVRGQQNFGEGRVDLFHVLPHCARLELQEKEEAITFLENKINTMFRVIYPLTRLKAVREHIVLVYRVVNRIKRCRNRSKWKGLSPVAIRYLLQTVMGKNKKRAIAQLEKQRLLSLPVVGGSEDYNRLNFEMSFKDVRAVLTHAPLADIQELELLLDRVDHFNLMQGMDLYDPNNSALSESLMRDTILQVFNRKGGSFQHEAAEYLAFCLSDEYPGGVCSQFEDLGDDLRRHILSVLYV